MTPLRHLVGGILAWTLAGLVFAAPPAVTHLFPSGAARGTGVEVSLGGTFDSWPVSVWSNHPGVSALPGKEKGKITVRIDPAVEPGVVWFRLHDRTGASGLRPFVIGNLPEIEEKEPNDEPARAQPIEPTAVVINGRLAKAGDVDCFAVRLKKGQPLVASLLAQRTLKSPLDGILQITSADGFVLAQSNDVFDLDPHVVFPAPNDGTYIVRLFAFPATPDAGIRFMGAETYVYRLTLTTTGFIDHTWPLAVPRGQPVGVELVGPGIPTGKKRLEIPAGADEERSLGGDELGGLAHLRFESHPCLLVEQVKDTAPPFTVTGRIEKAGQTIPLTFRGSKGKALLIQAEVSRVGSSLTPLLLVRDAEGKQLVRAEPKNPAQDVEITFTPPQDGLYRLEVSDLYRAGHDRGWFRLRVAPPEPGFTLTVASDRIAVNADKPTEVTVNILRRNGFKGDIELALDSPPLGVTAATVKPVPADGKTQILRFTLEKDAPGGPVRILGKSPVLPRPQVVEATLPELGTTTPYLWLTRGTVPAATKKK